MVAICALYVAMLYLIVHRYGVACACFGTTLAMSAVLFFTWYRNLPAPECAAVEEEGRVAPRG